MNPKQIVQISKLQQQNKRLQKAIDQSMQQIQHLKNINDQHQKQIQSLLKFNQRLLTIIQEEVNNNQSNFHQKSLQPISEVTQNDSQTMEGLMHSLQKTRKKLAARSQKGALYVSALQNKPSNSIENNKVYQYMNEAKDLERSQRYVNNNDKQYSEFGNKSSFSKKRDKKGSAGTKMDLSLNKHDTDHQVSMQILQRTSTQTKPIFTQQIFGMDDQSQRKNNNQNNQDNKANQITQKKESNSEYNKIQEEIKQKINSEIQEMRKKSHMNHDFLDDKINRLAKLSKQLEYNPEKKFTQLQNKIKLSPQMAALVKKAISKK